MDIKCMICGEPWDIDEVHEQISVNYPDEPWRDDTGKFMVMDYDRFFDEGMAAFRKKGCEYFDGAGHSLSRLSSGDREVLGEIYAWAGDDVDFAASMIEDGEQMGLFND